MSRCSDHYGENLVTNEWQKFYFKSDLKLSASEEVFLEDAVGDEPEEENSKPR